jgi:hypothetical protein
MRLYVYCLVEKIDTLAVPVSGVSGAPVKLITIEDFQLLASDFEGDSPPPVTRENALAHDAVVRSVLKDTTPLPFRFGSVPTETQLRSYITSHRTAIEAKLNDVRGCIEMSVKIISNPDNEETTATSPSAEEGPGARFLKEKQRELLGSERRGEEAKQVAAWLKSKVGRYVRQDEINLCPTEKLIVAAAHLIGREEITEYRGRLAEARKTRPDLHFLVSGPWPPYTFSNIELEFKTRFGVS